MKKFEINDKNVPVITEEYRKYLDQTPWENLSDEDKTNAVSGIQRMEAPTGEIFKSKKQIKDILADNMPQKIIPILMAENERLNKLGYHGDDLGYYNAASWDKLSDAAQDAFKQRFQTADDFFAQYIKDCTRTESILPELKIDKEMTIALFEMYTNLGELLDGLKKSIFYSKDTKFETIYAEKVQKILDIANVLKRRPAKMDKQLASDNLNKRLLHGILGVSTESSELVEILIELLKDPTKEVDSVNLHEECVGDIGWYTAILCDEYNLSWKQGLINNIQKLRVRFPEKFTIEDAINRDLKAERKELEK